MKAFKNDTVDPLKICVPTKWGCGRAFHESKEYFRPFKGGKAGYFLSYCRACELKRSRSFRVVRIPDPPSGPEKQCLGRGGCKRMLRKSDFYKKQGLCKRCYGARWVPYLREKRLASGRENLPPARPKIEKRCPGCRKTPGEVPFHKGRALCKACYNAKWAPLRRLLRSLRHGEADGGKRPLAANSKELPGVSRHPVGSQKVVHVRL